MKKQFLDTGKIVGTHGVRGTVRINPWCDDPAFLCGFKVLYTDDGKTSLKVKSARPHGNVVIADIDGVDTVEKAEKLRGKTVYINRKDINLPKGSYFVQDIIGCKVFDIQSGEELGVITDVSATGANDVWHIKRGENEYLIPKIDDIVKSVDVDSERVEILVMKGLFDDEN